MKTLVVILTLIALCLCSYGQGIITKLHAPDKQAAREFFNWEVNKGPVFGESSPIEAYDASGNRIEAFGKPPLIEGYSEFKHSARKTTLHVGNDTYNPFQPLVAYDLTTKAIEEMGLPYTVSGVGSFQGDRKIFAQFDIGAKDKTESFRGYTGSTFEVDGKEHKGLITMVKGNDASLRLMVFLTIICIVCQNTFRAAIKAGRENGVSRKQTKNCQNEENLSDLMAEILALFGYQETVIQTLKRMEQSPLSLDDAERAFLGLLKPGSEEIKQTGKTRLTNSVERYMEAFKTSPGVSGKTVGDWFNAVTYVNTQGNRESKTFNKDEHYIASEFEGVPMERKETAFQFAGNKQSFGRLIHTGSELQTLLSRPIVVGAVSTTTSDMDRLLAKSL